LQDHAVLQLTSARTKSLSKIFSVAWWATSKSGHHSAKQLVNENAAKQAAKVDAVIVELL